MKNKFHIICLLTFFSCLTNYAQNKSKTFKVNWKDQSDFAVISTKPDHKKITIPVVENGSFDHHFLPTFKSDWKVPSNLTVQSYSIKNIRYENISKNIFHKESQSFFPKSIQSKFEIKKARSIAYAILDLTPLVLQNNILKKIISFEIEYTLVPKIQTRTYSTIHDSPLATGNWYKFAVDTTGVYKLSRSFINSLGLNTSNANPKNIKIYGNGGRMLKELNSDFRYDDIQENAIYFEGEDDGVFNNNDFILFYAEGPDTWEHNLTTEKATHKTNIYSDKAYYFITVNEGLGKRIQNESEITGTSTNTITTFNDFMIHEKEEFNFDSFGQEFYGENFQIEDTQNFTFNFTNLNANIPISIKMKSGATEACNFILNVDGSNVINYNISGPGNTDVGGTFHGSGIFNATNDLITTEVIFNNNGQPSTRAYLDYIEINGVKNLIVNEKQFSFRNYQSTQTNNIVEYQIQNNDNIFQLWNVTDKINVSNIVNQGTGSNFSFKSLGDTLKEYIIVNANDYFEPEQIRQSLVGNQNLHAIQDIDYLIITPDELRDQAQRLADYHEENSGYTTLIVSPEKIYNEFSSGAQDITAIRDFVRHLYMNASTPEKRVRYVLMFGDTSFDFKNIEGNNDSINLMAYQSIDSFDLATSFVSDDFFGMMDETEGVFAKSYSSISDRQDVATGRMPVKNIAEAKSAIDRTLAYYSSEALGKWRNQITLVTDDVDNQNFNYTLEITTEQIADNIKNNFPVYNITKIYADAFVQEISAGGERYPIVKEAITNAVERGTLILNYFGHGGENGWASERFLDVPQVQNWYNEKTLPLFSTITCEFSRFDNPSRNTAGEFLFSNSNGGSVNMLTTTREVFITFGGNFNTILMNNLLLDNEVNNYSIAEVLMNSKNQSGNGQRLFIYFFGDPAMKLPIAKPDIKITEMNDVDVNVSLDTIKALSHVYFKGVITNNTGTVLPDFNGELFATIYDKSVDRLTLNNDNFVTSNGVPAILEFDSRESKIFSGKASVVNGNWEFDFIAPRDIRIAYGKAKLSFYADDNLIDKAGYNTAITIGGINENAPEDDVGPTIRLFMNDESFIDGGNTNESPMFLAILEDPSGINTSLTAVDHDIIAILDNDESSPIIMNDFYETELNDFTKGRVEFPFRNLEVGLHTLKFKCWDTYNNSSEATLNFVVVSDNKLVLDNVLNYPNPFLNYTEFWFNHNKPNESLEAQVQIFTVSGKLIKTLNQSVLTNGTHSRSITWDGLDDFGNKIGKGVYIYKLSVRTLTNGLKSEKFEKLVILQ